ncbi:MAG: DNA starvation/stationary phase protection protein [Brucellaceae bacterium]|nr:DNA starvation/stationary phase protection protein [Brucellaceae bacterium]
MPRTATVLKPEPHAEKISTGLDAGYRKSMAESLTEILASTYKLTIKSHVYHWNVVGPLFLPLHELTEQHYGELFAATDVIAERIRALGHLAPNSVGKAASFSPSSSSVDHLSAHDMVADLIDDHEAATRQMRDAAEKAGDAGDVVTEDMLTQRLTFHEKALWMLRAIIAE